jgi:hypothetical protein
MPLAASRNAIGAIDLLLRAQLTARTTVGAVDIGRVEQAALSDGPKFNLFLYQVDIDGQLRNHPLDRGQRTPVWLVLRYLLTAFDVDRDSDSATAHELLGEGLLALEELNFQRPTVAALADNPEPLKFTFDAADVELLSKIMQGSDERYRVSTAFQVRPVLIAPSEPPAYGLPVLSVGPPANEGVAVIPSLGPVVDAVEPERFEAGATLTLRGRDFLGESQWVCLGGTCFPVTGAPSGAVQAQVPADTALSAGSHPVTFAYDLPSGRRLHSNAVNGDLQPTVTGAAPTLPLAADAAGNLSGTLTLSGSRLGGPDDDIFVAFWRNGAVARMLEATGTAAQTTLTATVTVDDALPPRPYRIILRINGVQAPATPEVDWS